jgi:cell wall-associated NlpC family hydrolase
VTSDADDAAHLIERLLADPSFRERFLHDPQATCRAQGLDRLADEIAGLGDDPVQALEARESRSSLGGVVMVAAIEGVGLYEMSERLLPNINALPTEVADLVSRVNLPAVGADAPPPPPHPAGAASGLPAADAPGPPVPDPVVPEEHLPGYQEPGQGVAPAAEHVAAAPQADVGPPPDPTQYGADGTGGPPSAEATAVLHDHHIVLDDTGRKDFSEGRMDPRLGSILLRLAHDHQITVSSTTSDHPTLTTGGSVSNHSVGRGLDIAAIDGEAVNPSSAVARLVAGELADLPPSIRPTEVGTPWNLAAPGFFTDGDHQDHLHVAFDDPISPDWKSPDAAPAAEAAAPSNQAPPDVPGRRYDSMIGPAVTADAPRGGDQLADMALSGGGYPGAGASKAEYAQWMAAAAAKRGLPPELPVMASLVESGLANLSGGDADSVGFFQMRLSVWNGGPYAGYPDNPDLQLKWFLDQAESIKQARLSHGESVTDPNQYGDWIADVERPAEQFRYRYQLRLSEARGLLEHAQPAGDHAQLVAEHADAPSAAAGPRALAAVAEAKKYLGTPYLWGGSTPQTGFDCSGLMQWAYHKAGIQIPRVTYDQIDAPNAIKVARHDLRPGDLVFFASPSGDVHHVGMSLGGDKFIHAPHTGDVVKISSLNESYYSSEFAGGRRFDDAAPGLAAVPDERNVASARAALDRDAAEVARHDSMLFRAVQDQEQRKNASLAALRAVNPGS